MKEASGSELGKAVRGEPRGSGAGGCVVQLRAAAAWGERKESVSGAGTGALDAASDPEVQGGGHEEALRQDVVKVARRFGRYGYRMVTAGC